VNVEGFEPPTFDNTVLGLPLDVEIKEIGMPLDAFVVVKSYLDGEPAYRITSTANLTSVECLGMLEWAKNVLMNTMFIAGMLQDDEDEEDDDES
jgi:DNA relaxase NicK